MMQKESKESGFGGSAPDTQETLPRTKTAAVPALYNMTWRRDFTKSTENLETDLKNAGSYESFLKENRNELAFWSLPQVLRNISNDPPLMRQFRKEPGLSDAEEKQAGSVGEEKALSVSNIVQSAKLNRSFYYEIINGKTDPSRDVLICLALALRCGLDPANELLRYGLFPGLYIRDRRDAVLISCIYKGKTVEDANRSLDTIDLIPLKKNRTGGVASQIPGQAFQFETDEFARMLLKAETLKEFFDTYDSEFLEDTFKDNLNRIYELKKRSGPDPGLTEADVMDKSHYLLKDTGYQYFSGRRIPSRNNVILLGFGLDCTVDEMQQLLRSSGNAALYVRFERDCIILKCRSRGLDSMKTNEELYRYFMKKYKESRINRKDAEMLVQKQLITFDS